MENIDILFGDITQAEEDAIVNAANPTLLGGGGVDGAIHKAAGPELLQACKEIGLVNNIRCPYGEARITPAGNLKSKYVIHAVGPIYSQACDPEVLLKSAYENSCLLAQTYHCQSIAFPAISCGAYGYPHKEAAAIAIAVCGAEKYRHLHIRFYLFEHALYEIFNETLLRLIK